MKASALAFATPLARFIHYCLKTSCWIREWKSNNISPVFEKGCEATKANYCHISILTCVSKVFERIMKNQLYSYFAQSCLLSNSLSGFLMGYSCCTALLKITEDWTEALDEKQIVNVASIDFSMAFDTIFFHCLQLRKLRHM